MPVITEVLAKDVGCGLAVPVPLDRHTLEKRRWRTRAEDGTDLAVDLAAPCRDGDVLLAQDERFYFVRQIPEKVICIPLPPDAAAAAQLGWFLGNQHLQIEIREGSIRLAHNELLLKKLEQAKIKAFEAVDVFNPDPHSKSHHHH